MRSALCVLAIGALAIALPVSLAHGETTADAFLLELPVDCEMGAVCVVQHYVDMDPGPGFKDHTCGSLTYNNHDGIDIRTLTHAQMRAGVNVVAAAAGRVLRIRNAMPDRVIDDQASTDAVKGREAGNGVVIDHGGGWETQYSHLKRGSVVVSPGDRVTAGQPIGRIGLSGKTQFPHLHFTLRRSGSRVDPFTGRAPGTGCDDPGRGWWSESALEALTYRPGGLLAGGFSGAVLSFPKFLEAAEQPTVSEDSPVLFAWAVAWGLRKGDLWTLELKGPSDQTLAEKTSTLNRHRIRAFMSVGRNRPKTGWPPGAYQATVKLVRPEGPHAGVLAEQSQRITLP